MNQTQVEGARRKHCRAMCLAPYRACVHSDDCCVKRATRMSRAPCDHIDADLPRNAGPLSAEAKMSNVAVATDVQPPAEFLWSEDIGLQMIMLPKK